MAEAAKFENLAELVDGSKITGPCRFSLLLTAGSDAASLTLTIGSKAFVIKAAANSTMEFQNLIRLGGNVEATVTLTGTSPVAYAVHEVE